MVKRSKVFKNLGLNVESPQSVETVHGVLISNKDLSAIFITGSPF